MIVVDASAMTELLLQTPLGSRVEARLLGDDDDRHALHLLDVEVVQALRRLVRAGDVPALRAEEAVEDLTLFDFCGMDTSISSIACGAPGEHDSGGMVRTVGTQASCSTCLVGGLRLVAEQGGAGAGWS